MSKQVYWILQLNIKPGRFNDFQTLVSDMVKATEANEPGTLNYEWSVNEDQTGCHIYERYRDSESLMVHLGNFQTHFAERFFDILDATAFSVYGNPSDQVKEALAGLGAQFLSEVGGFAR